MAILTQQELGTVRNALIAGGIDGTMRPILFQFIDLHYVASLQAGLPPAPQIMADIGHMNRVERLANGDIPLYIYLNNALPLLAGAPQQEKTIRLILSMISQRISGAPPVNVDIAKVPELKEVIIHSDDTLPFLFMEKGIETGKSVMKLLVPAFSNGQPKLLPGGSQVIGKGTGWLLTPSLLITNHHVINARMDGEPDAGEADFLLQGKQTSFIADFNYKDTDGQEALCLSVEASDKVLDYAILRIPDTGRRAVKLAPSKLNYTNQPVAVNIIQHPNGRSKRFAIRNNLVSGTADTELRYFTDTEGGSSGSPVLNDNWEAVALHKGAAYVEGTQFQGKATAYVNVGTHVVSILEHLQNNYPALLAEIKNQQ